MRRLPLALVGLLLLTACAGKADPQSEGRIDTSGFVDTGHGSVEDVLAILAREQVPCEDPTPIPPDEIPQGIEQAVRCTLQPGGAQVTMVHFYGPQYVADFERATLADGARGLFTDTWAMRSKDRRAVEQVAEALTPD